MTPMVRMIRRALVVAALAALTACTAPPTELPPDVDPIGDFRMGFNIVVAPDPSKGPVSREASNEQLEDAVRAAVEQRLGRYDGDGLYHLGVKVEGYALGRAGVPVLFSPKSILVVVVNIWDDATQEKLNPEPIQITAFEAGAGPLVGSGLVRDGDAQLAALAFNAAKEIEEKLAEERDNWFAPKDGRERLEFERDPETGRQKPVEDGAGDEGAETAAENSSN